MFSTARERSEGRRAPGTDQLPTAEQEYHDPGLVHSADEPGELLRLVLHPVETERDRDQVQVDAAAQVGRGHDVLDLDPRVLDHMMPGLSKKCRDGPDRVVDLSPALPPGTDDLARVKEQNGGPRFGHSIDEPGELGGFVLGSIEREGDRWQVEGVAERGRRYDVLDANSCHTYKVFI